MNTMKTTLLRETIAIRLPSNSGSHARVVTYAVNEVPGHNPGPPRQIAVGQPFAGLNTIPYEYTVSSVAKNAANEQEAALGAQFSINSVPIFQFFAFYNSDLEFLPGPPASVSGRIHTNGNLYLDAGSGLTIADRPTATATTAANPSCKSQPQATSFTDEKTKIPVLVPLASICSKIQIRRRRALIRCRCRV